MEQAYKENPNGKFRLGGHSKGGNLALYVALMCSDEARRQIIQVYSNDDPGLCPDLIPQTQMNEIADRLVFIRPEFCIIGMLFDTGMPFKIVRSSANSFMQHDAMTWQVERDNFLTAPKLSPNCRLFNSIFDDWIESAPMDQRKSFTNDFFDALEVDGAKRISEISGGVHSFGNILFAICEANVTTKAAIGALIKSIFSNLRKVNYWGLIKKKESVQSILLLLLCIFLIAIPQRSMYILSNVFFFYLLSKSVLNLYNYWKQYRQGQQPSKVKTVFFLAVTVIDLLLLIQNHIVVITAKLALAGFFGYRAYCQFQNAASQWQSKNYRKICFLMDAILCCILCIVAFSISTYIFGPFILSVGTYLAVYAMTKIVRLIWKESRHS